MIFSDVLKQTIEHSDLFFQKDGDGDELHMDRSDAKKQTLRLRRLIDRYSPSSSQGSVNPLGGVVKL